MITKLNDDFVSNSVRVTVYRSVFSSVWNSVSFNFIQPCSRGSIETFIWDSIRDSYKNSIQTNVKTEAEK